MFCVKSTGSMGGMKTIVDVTLWQTLCGCSSCGFKTVFFVVSKVQCR